MKDINLVSDYKDNSILRASFNELTTSVFCLNFEQWYQKGGWNDRYICYSYVSGNKVVANASINKMDIILEGQRKTALQIGTVMTHPEYRNKGLSKNLMNIILETYEQKYDFIYLFANKNVLNFYPRFGFYKLTESEFSIDYKGSGSPYKGLKKLDISNINDFKRILQVTSKRTPVSSILGVKNDQHLLLFYCLYIFSASIYYLEEEDTIVIFKEKENELLLFDVISKNNISFPEILDKITSEKTKKVIFHFTPDPCDFNFTSIPLQDIDSTLFIKASSFITKSFRFPITSHA